MTDDDEDWDYDPPRPATPDEIAAKTFAPKDPT